MLPVRVQRYPVAGYDEVLHFPTYDDHQLGLPPRPTWCQLEGGGGIAHIYLSKCYSYLYFRTFVVLSSNGSFFNLCSVSGTRLLSKDGLCLTTIMGQQSAACVQGLQHHLLPAPGHGCGGHLQLMAGQLPGQGPQPHHTGVQHRGRHGLAVACVTNTTLAWLPVEGSVGCSSETDMSLWES